MNGEELEEFWETRQSFRGVSRGPGASLDRAIQQAAEAAAEAGLTGREMTLDSIVIEPQGHNQWVKGFSVNISER